MTVAELIEALQQLPQGLEVVVPEDLDYARVTTVGPVRIAARRLPGVLTDGDDLVAIAFNFDPADLS